MDTHTHKRGMQNKTNLDPGFGQNYETMNFCCSSYASPHCYTTLTDYTHIVLDHNLHYEGLAMSLFQGKQITGTNQLG